MKPNPKFSWFLALALTFLYGGTGFSQITLSLSAYQSPNYLADGLTVVPNNTILKLGYFHSGGSFTSAASLGTQWGGLTGSISSRLASFDDTFYTLKADNGQLVQTTAGEAGSNQGKFWISINPTSGDESDSRFLTTLNVQGSFDPILNGVNAVGFKPFVWVETADRSQFGLFEATSAMPTGLFPNLSLDLVIGTTGFTPVVGTLAAKSFTLIPEPSTSALLGGSFLALFHRIRKQNRNPRI
jgi:hypothetical protein